LHTYAKYPWAQSLVPDYWFALGELWAQIPPHELRTNEQHKDTKTGLAANLKSYIPVLG
jgi:hypothetical protein